MDKKIFELITESLRTINKEVCFARKIRGEWQPFSASYYDKISDQLAIGLLRLGMNPGDRIMIVSENRPEWNFADLAIMKAGIITVPLYATISDKDLVEIANETESRLIFVSGKFLFRKITALMPSLPIVEKIVSFEKIEEVMSMEELAAEGKKYFDRAELAAVQEKISPDDMYTILYTSGTTGAPKGVMLTHKSHLSIINDLAERSGACSEYNTMSYLPLNHIFEKTVTYLSQINGMSVYYAEGLGNIIQNFQEVKPHFLSTVPMLLEKVYENIMRQGEKLESPVREKYAYAIELAVKYDMNIKYSEEEKMIYNQIDELFYSKWRGILGGNLKTVLCGGAKMQRELFHLFWAAKVPLLQGYGLSETSGLISIDRHGDIIKLNKCGRSMNHIEVKLAEDGEILARGIPIMLGYYKHPEITAQEIDSEGWFKSGDIGTIDEDGYIEIISRKKSTFKNMSGKYVYPETLEGMLKKSGLIGNVIVTGVNRPNLVALIVPDFEFLKTWCDNNGIEFAGPQQMIVDERVIQAFRKAIDEYNVQNWTETERISDFVLLADQWSIETGEYTPTMKVRRNAVLEKYNDLIERIYKK